MFHSGLQCLHCLLKEAFSWSVSVSDSDVRLDVDTLSTKIGPLFKLVGGEGRVI